MCVCTLYILSFFLCIYNPIIIADELFENRSVDHLQNGNNDDDNDNIICQYNSSYMHIKYTLSMHNQIFI